MKKSSSKNLFREFAPASKEQWKQQAIEDLKGADYTKKLVWHTHDHFDLEPYYTREESQPLGYLQKYLRKKSPIPGQEKGRYWLNLVKVTETNPDLAVKLSMAAVENGADGIYFEYNDASLNDLASLARKIMPLKCHTVYKSGKNALTYLSLAMLKGRSTQPLDEQSRGSIHFDPIQQWTRTGQWDEQSFQLLKDLATALKPIPNFKALTISSSHLHDTGATASQELAYVLNTMVDYIDILSNLGTSVQDIVDTLQFEISVGTSYFVEIAKLKALRILCSRILGQYEGVEADPEDLFIHSSSSLWSKTIFDPYVNMLRNTTEAMSAIIGGCDALTISPHDVRYSNPVDFSRRITKNISIILKEESYFDKTQDPAAGSYYIDHIIDQLVQNALQIFKEIEAQGGFIASFRQGIIQNHLEASSEEKDKQVARRKEVFVGTNQYPNVEETIDPEAVKQNEQNPVEEMGWKLLVPRSGAAEIEAIRMNTERWIKNSNASRRPEVYLSLVGQNAAMRSARATFATNYLGCAGFIIKQSPLTHKLETSIENALGEAAEVTVICGSDDDYQAHAVQYAQRFKTGHPSGLLILAGNPGDMKGTFESAGFDGFIHLQADLIDTLTELQHKLSIKES